MIVSRQAKDMLNKLPATYDPFEVKARLQIMGITQPMNIFLKQEIDRMQVVIKLVRSMLKDLLLAIDGVIIMNEVRIYFFIFIIFFKIILLIGCLQKIFKLEN